MRLGIDVGSTTVKFVLTDEKNKIIYSKYKRHMSEVKKTVQENFDELIKEKGNISTKIVITGSGGLSLAESLGVKFEQEVICSSRAIEELIPETDVAIELGGEDAKLTFFGTTIEQRMNGTCAGGTGAFIDQMAVLLHVDLEALNEAASKHKLIYPIAARCGVFAKTDIQPLINEGATIEDLSASIFQAVVNQTISGLACGRTIKGNVAFLGGPLSFMPQLRQRFIETLDLKNENVFFPENSKYFVAIGAAILSQTEEEKYIEDVLYSLINMKKTVNTDVHLIPALFKNKQEREEFNKRHSNAQVKKKNISNASGNVYLGIDAGSTTTKAALIDEDNNLLYSFYHGNQGKPLETTRTMLYELYSKLPSSCRIVKSCVTGYGESLLKTAFKVDLGEIETMAHYKAADHFLPGVNFILDIGGQDMKCMKVKDGIIYNIMLNEACSSGCGSFLETYAKSLNMDVENFAKVALEAKAPVDLGTRCTVFMNSKVKQAQKEGAEIGDISAGLSYSVIKNALYKVIKLRDPEEIGEKIVVQGGTFKNQAVLRSFEKIIGKDVICPDISGIMGAYGAAIIAKENQVKGEFSNILAKNELDKFNAESKHTRCKLCENNCLLTINLFNDGSRLVSGNRCERGAGANKVANNILNLYDYKNKRLFDYKPLPIDKSKGQIGIPRVLNMYENYPFWFTFFNELGFSVLLSPQSSKEMYEKGMDTISSDTACYPAKLVHGHIKWLVNNGSKLIFYPNINYEIKEDKSALNHYNCPIVGTYPEVIKNNMDDVFLYNNVKFLSPFLPYDNDKRLAKELYNTFQFLGVKKNEIENAVKLARKEDLSFKSEIKKMGEKGIEIAKSQGRKAIVLSGRPYHLDPEINHGIDKLITQQDMVVLTEDSVAHLLSEKDDLRVLDQWMYHSRLYKAAQVVGLNDNLEIIQLNSFGCGLDAITTDQVEEICKKYNKIYTLLKIDEGSNLGAVKIRVRSLKAALEERSKKHIEKRVENQYNKRVVFTRDMRKEYTLLIPQMSPIHFDFVEVAIKNAGYNTIMLPSVDNRAVEEGLKYVNNDACYPSIVALGQIIAFLKTTTLDKDKLGILLSQTGGGCRASNYIPLLRKALKELNMGHIPIVSVNPGGLEKNPGFHITLPMVKRAVLGLLYGDILMKVLYRTRPYELKKGSADELYEQWRKIIKENVIDGDINTFKKNVKGIIRDFEELPLQDIKKPRVGVVGEILVKYHPTANNDIVSIIENEGGEAVVLDLLDFFLYGMISAQFNFENLSGSYWVMRMKQIGIRYVEKMRNIAREELKNSNRFDNIHNIQSTANQAEEILSLGNQCGEGWLLTGEMAVLMDSGVNNILCLQPFACLPNHVTGKGMMKALRKRNPYANIMAIDYDPGASTVNQLNRIKLMMSTAHKNV